MPKSLYLIITAALLLGACNKNKVEEENLWGLHQEPVQAQKLPDDSGVEELTELWKEDIGNGASVGFAQLVPVYHDGSVFVANRIGEVFRLGSQTGDVEWKVDLGQDINAAVGAGQDLIIVGHDNGEVTAIKAMDGVIAWKSSVKRHISAVPVVGRGRIIIRTSDGLIIGLDSQTGQNSWQVKKQVPGLTVHGDSTPVITGDAVLTGLSNGKLIANNVITGRDYWEAEISFVKGQNEIERLNDSDTPPIIQGTTVYTATYQGSIMALQLQDAATIWRTELSTRLPMAVGDNTLYITSDLGAIAALSTDDGRILWQQDIFIGHGVSQPVVVGARLVIGDSDGNVHTLDIVSGALVESRKVASGAILGVVTDGRKFTVISSTGDLRTLSL